MLTGISSRERASSARQALMMHLLLALLVTAATRAEKDNEKPASKAAVSGHVLGRDGKPIRDAVVEAFPRLVSPDAELPQGLMALTNLPEAVSVPSSSARTDAAGAFRIVGLEADWYSLRVVADGFSPAREGAVTASAEGVRVVLPPGGTLDGVVRDASGKAVASAVVDAYAEPQAKDILAVIRAKSQPPIESVKSDDAGKFRFRRLGTGLYNFRVSAAKFQTYADTRIPVVPGDTRNFTLEPGKVLRGVVSGPQGKPIAGVRVRVLPERGSRRQGARVNIQFDDGSILTDQRGAFVFDTLGDGKYSLLASHPDYAAVQLRDVRTSGDALSVKLSRGRKISGRVVDATTREPVPGARVSALDIVDIKKETTTDAKGQYTIPGLSPRRRRSVTVSVRAKGYAPLKVSVRNQTGDTIAKDFELAPTGSVRGRVVGSDAVPLSGARVEVRRARGQGSRAVLITIAVATTDSAGRFLVREVEPGSGRKVQVVHPGYLVRPTDAFAVQSRQVTDLGDIRVEEGAAIEGRVLSRGERPVRACVVEALESGATLTTKTARTDKLGHYRLQGLEKGTFTLSFRASGFLPARRGGVEAHPGRKTVVAPVILERGRELSGRVLSSTGRPVIGAEVIVLDTGRGVVRHSERTGGSGAFQFSAIASKDFVSVAVHHADYEGRSLEKVAVGENLEIVLRELGRISGRVTDTKGQPVASFAILPAAHRKPRSQRQRLRSRSFTLGRFEYAGMPEGTYDIHVRAVGLAQTTVPDVEVKREQVVDLGAIVLAPGDRVEGRVVDAATGKPLAGARVRIVDRRALRQATSKASQTTSDDGRFSLTGLKGGARTLEVTLDGYVRKRVSGVNPLKSSTSRDLVVKLERSGTILGTVRDASGRALPALPVYLIDTQRRNSNNRRVKTDEKGSFRFDGLAPGSYTIKALTLRPGQKSLTAQKKVEVRSGETATVGLTVEEK